MPKVKNKWTGEMKELAYDYSGENEARELIASGAWEKADDEASTVGTLEINTSLPKIEIDTNFDSGGFDNNFKTANFDIGKSFGIEHLKKIAGFGDISVKKLELGYGDEKEDDDNFGF